MSFSGTTAGATAECVETVSASAGVSASASVFASAGAIYSLTGAVIAFAKAICSFR